MTNDLKELERQVADELAASLVNNPNAWNWTDGDLDLLRGPEGVRMGASYFTIYSPATVRFGFWNRRRIRRAFRRWEVAAGNDLADSEHRRALLLLRRCVAQPLRAAA